MCGARTWWCLLHDAEAILANAPERDGPFFRVPKILEDAE